MRDFDSGTDPWKIAIGVAAGILMAGATGFLVRVWLANRAIEEMARAVNEATAASQRQIQLAAQESRRREAERVAAVAAQQRLQEERVRAVEAAKRAKEDAWARYYRKPAHCDQAEGDAFVECANDFIRAKRRFEALYAAGKL